MPRIARVLMKLLPIAGFVVVWGLITRWEVFSILVLPPPSRVLSAARQLLASGDLQVHALASLKRVAGGFLLGSLLGVILGLGMAHSRFLERLLRPTIEMFRPVAALVLIPLVLVWFGIGDTGKILLIAYGSFYPTWTNTFDGARYVDPRLLHAARSLGCHRHRTLWRVRLPAALPNIATGLSLGIGTAFSVLIAAELMGASSGLGWMIADARRFFRTEIVLLGMFVIGMLGLVTVGLLQAARDRIGWMRRAGT
ncbi:MAG: ABC transporter permease subunit [Nitriliruptorales bacterium]|nr:ABC transporter permease subunit [Nitriliruptorales bacterium]